MLPDFAILGQFLENPENGCVGYAKSFAELPGGGKGPIGRAICHGPPNTGEEIKVGRPSGVI